jgi:hypothetical protein
LAKASEFKTAFTYGQTEIISEKESEIWILLTISLLICAGFFHKVLARLKHGNAKSHFTLSGAITISETISFTETQRFGAISSANSYINF